MAMSRTTYAALTGAEQDELDRGEAKNGAIHAVSLTLTKCAGGLIDPKLVLSWLLNSLGAPAFLTGALVPVREAGALLPQLAIARRVQAAPRRKVIWAGASILQGLAALAIAASVMLLDGTSAGWAVLFFLALLAIARSGASLSYKDALARTIPKTRRGAVSGLPGSIAAGFTLAYGASLASGLLPLNATVLALGIALGGAFWIAGGLLFLNLDEPAAETAPKEARDTFSAFVAPLMEDGQLRRFILARALLTVTALAPPFIVMLSTQEERTALDQLGPLILASGAASIVSGYVWGRFSDHSSRQTMMASAILAALVFAIVAAVGIMGDGLGPVWRATAAIFGAQVAYEGVRAARKLHLTDMAGDDRRARYTALSNSAIGLVLLLGGGFGVLAHSIGAAPVLAVFAVLSLLGALVATGLEEVQRKD